MKIQLLTLCMCLGIWVNAQSFQWDNNTQATSQASVATQNQINTKHSVTAKTPMVDEVGVAHPYPEYYDGSPTASGETFYQNQLTAGHKSLPIGTIVKIARVDNGLSTTVRINDRGAYCDGCIIDLSAAAAQQIGLLPNHKANVTLTVIDLDEENPSSHTSTPPSDGNLIAKGGEITDAYNTDTQGINCIKDPTASSLQVSQNANDKGIHIIEAPIAPFAVQLGSYNNYSNAEKHALSLQDKGFNNVFILKELQNDQKTLNRVIVTPFNTLNEAENYITDLKAYHNMKGLVFQTMLIEVEE